MTSLENVLKTVRFQKDERTPVIPQIFGHAAIHNKVPLNRYLRDGKTLAECQISSCEYYEGDAVFGLMDVNVECEALGAELIYREDNYPYIKRTPFEEGEAIPTSRPLDPKNDGRMPELLESIRTLRREMDNKVLVTSCLLGPFTLTTQLLGMERALYMIHDDRPKLMEWLRFATDIQRMYGVAQLKAGTQVPIIFDPSGTQDVLTPKLFCELEVPFLKELVAELKTNGAQAVWLHIAGPTNRILETYAKIGVDVANFDAVRPEEAMNALPNTCLDGNINTLSFVLDSPASIRKRSQDLVDSFRSRGGFILSSGCELPLESRPECIKAMIDAAKGDRDNATY